MRTIILCILHLILFQNGFGQTKRNIALKNGIITTFSISDNLEKEKLLQPVFWETGYYAILYFENEVEKNTCQNNGILMLDFLAKNTYAVFIPKNFDCSLHPLKQIAIIPAGLKYNTNDLPPVVKGQQQYLVVSFFGIPKEDAKKALAKVCSMHVSNPFASEKELFINYQIEMAPVMAAFPFVISVSYITGQITPLNNESRAAHNISAVTATGGRNLTGRGVTVGHGDIGLPQDHLDISSKSIDRYTGGGNFHGNHTSGTVSGAGIINEKHRGIAFKSPTVNTYFTDVLVNTPAYVADYKMVSSNNSYHAGNPGCTGNGAYNSMSNYMDKQSNDYPGILQVFAAGNDGTFSCAPYLPSFHTVKSGFQTAKNVITVGSMNTDTYSIAALSSRGPIFDGRIKPEIVAKGENATSTVPFNIYDFTTGGTSMAAPVVTGAIALLQERYKQLNSGNLANSDLVKALLCNLSDDMGNPGPDYTYGFGMLNLRKSIEAMEQNQYFNGTIAATGAQNNHSITVPANTRRLKIMLNYIDKEANTLAASSLVNDLDLSVTTPLAVHHISLVLNNSPLNVNNNATEAVDHINPIEQVIIENPIPGIYNINISGFNLPFNNQNYVVVYGLEMNGITLEYPFGNDKLVPGETEKIRWQGYGNETNNYTLEYSNNNGSSWAIIDANIPATSRSYNWTLPATATNLALVKVTRNGTAYTDSSDFNFTVLGVPTLTIFNVCEGAVQLNWNSITDATGYEVMIKEADSMKVIATTTSLNYLVQGLQSNKEQWFSVRALNGAKSGRRAVARNTIPNSGPCTLTDFDNDIKLVSINTPNTGRYLTSNAANALQVINVTIKNNDDVVSNSAILFNYSINGGPTVTETITPLINAGAFFNFSFASHSPSPLPAVYQIKVWVSKSGDNIQANDTLKKTVKLLTNPVLTLPYTEDFEATGIADYLSPVIGLENNDTYDIGFNSIYGRARTFVNSGFAYSGSRSVTLDQLNVGSFTTDTLIGTYNLSSYDTATHQLRLDFYYKDHGQEDAYPNNKVWIRGSDTDNWIEAINLGADQEHLGVYNLANVNINDVLASATPKQNLSTGFQVAFGQQGIKPAVNITPIDRFEDGYTYDNIQLINAINDISLNQIISPAKNGCNYTATTPVTVQVRNYSATVQNNIQVSYQVNNGPVISETIAVLNAKATMNYTFSATANLALFIDYSFNFWVSFAPDNYKGNDSILQYNFHNSPLVTVFPYLERFESSDGNWYSKGTNSTWAWGSPTKPVITKAANGTKIWTTNLFGGYNSNEYSYLTSPCFDLTGVTNPMLSFAHITRVEDDCPCDYSWMEYSTNGGLTWQKLGANGQGTNWYDDATTQRWQASKTHWHVATIPIPTNSSTTKFRYVMNSDPAVNFGGIGLDDIHIYSGGAPVYTGTTISSGLTQVVSGNNWVHFNSGTDRVLSLQPNSNNLGNTEAKVYNYIGPVRNSNGQYYVNRNMVVQPATPPASAVTVRFYFTDTEVENLLSASGCVGCTKPADAFELGVTKYSGALAVENGDLGDNTGLHEYILPGFVDVIPYENGYYAEYNVSSFSEFWLNNGGLTYTLPLPVSLLYFEAFKQEDKVQLSWKTENETNVKHYEIERSGNGVAFTKIGKVTARNNTSNLYQFIDEGPLPQTNYYRLKITDLNGNFHYAAIRLVSFRDKKLLVVVSPNPSKDKIIQISANENINNISLVNSSGKIVYRETINRQNKVIRLTALPAGLYTIKVHSENDMVVKKLVLE